MTRTKTARYACIALCVAATIAGAGRFSLSASPQSDNGASPDFVTIEVLSPVVGKNGEIPTEATSGWPLTLRLTSHDELGIGSFAEGNAFPTENEKALLVFENPDGCISWRVNEEPCPIDETYVEFTPGHGTSNPYVGPEDIIPRLYVFDGTSRSNILETIGPSNYGPSGRLPGLVVVSDAGVGLVFDEHFNLPRRSHPRKRTPLQGRNLAGFLSAVDYELNDVTGHTSLVAQISVPSLGRGGLFNPLVLFDDSLGATGGLECPLSGTSLVRVDGGKIAELPFGSEKTDRTVTVRAFVVNGVAPWVLSDLDNDGAIHAKDAELAGYSLLSQEAVIQVRFFEDNSFGIPYDFDGNGCAVVSQGPPSPGTLSRIPR